jgi:hypothetical protein
MELNIFTLKFSRCYLVILVLSLVSCASSNMKDQKSASQTPSLWTLDFFHFYKGTQTHSESFQFASRRDCFDAMYQMQVDSRKKPQYSGSGVCTKWFSEGQERTHNDVLGYK